MPSKCPFCRRKYMRSGAYEKHLRTAHANLDIVLASTVRYTSSVDIINDVETSILHHREASELRDSDYESDPDPARTSSTHLLLTSLILRYRMTLRLRYPADRSIIH